MQGRLTRKSSVTVLALTGALAAVGVGYAAIPGGDGVIHGCYSKLTGQLRIIDAEAGARCTGLEKALDVNERGPKGDTGPRGLTGDTGPRGLTGDTGPRGLTGDTGPRGLTGDIGPRGLQGEAGKDGVAEFPDTLPAGKTLQGAWSIHGVNTGVAGTQIASDSISFGIPLKTEWIWNPLWEVGQPYNPNCTGTAKPGHLCVYLDTSHNLDGVAIFDAVSGVVGAGGRTGAGLSAIAAAEGAFYASGTWAVTAP
jgi:hypothetical protein